MRQSPPSGANAASANCEHGRAESFFSRPTARQLGRSPAIPGAAEGSGRFYTAEQR
jgi:hypothetical protein